MSTMDISTQHYTGELEEVLSTRNIVAKIKHARKRAAVRPLQGRRRMLFGIPTVLPMFPSVNIYTPDYEGDGFR